MWESALSQETMRTVSIISPEEGQGDNLLLCFGSVGLKVSFHDQVVNLQVLPSEGADPAWR